jgi:diacylglycerol kinase (ATP)
LAHRRRPVPDPQLLRWEPLPAAKIFFCPQYVTLKLLPMIVPELLIIANPAAGGRKGLQLARQVYGLLRSQNQPIVLAVTSQPGEASRWAAEAVKEGVKVVVACGGDGTVQEIAGALAGSHTALGILPCGRGNDLARALGIWRKDTPEQLAQVIVGSAQREIDLGLFTTDALVPSAVEPRAFCTVATLGLDSAVSRFVHQHHLPFKGALAYLYGILRVLPSYKAPLARLSGDFGTYEGHTLLVATANSPFYGGGLQIVPDARLDDGILHLCVVRPISKPAFLRVLPQVFNGRHIHHPAVHIFRSQSVNIQTPDGPERICADGEILGQTPARLQVWPRALQVKVKAY